MAGDPRKEDDLVCVPRPDQTLQCLDFVPSLQKEAAACKAKQHVPVLKTC